MILTFSSLYSTTVFYSSHSQPLLSFFFFNDTATTEIYTLSLHDALPISYAWRDYVRNTWRALPALALPALILGGIASGAFTPTEASVIAVFYALFAGRAIYRTLEWTMLPGILARSALMTASVLIIVAMSAAFAWVLTISRVPQGLTALIVGMQLSPLAFLLAVNALLLAFGIFIEPLPGIVVLVPIR